MNGFFGRKTNTQRALSRLMMTSALVAAGTLVLSSVAMAGPWDDVTGTGFTSDTSNANITNIAATTKNGKASGTGNLDILLGQTVNIDASLFIARDNRPTIQTQILGSLNSTGKVILIDRNGVLFGKGSSINVGSIIATTGDVSDSLALVNGDAPLLFSNFGTGEIVNNGSIAASGLVAFVAPTVKNNGVINANLGRVSLAAGDTTATVDLYGDGLVEFSASALGNSQSKFLSENTGSVTGGKIQMTAAAAKSLVDSVVNMQGVLTANSAIVNTKGDIVLSAGKVVLGSASVKSPAIKGNTKATATQLDLGLTVDGNISGSAKVVNVLSTKAKIAQGLTVVSEKGTVNVAAGTYNEHLVIDKDSLTLNGANAGKSANGVRSAETIINPNSPGVEITADDVTIDGLTFSNALNADGYGIFVNGGDNATLKNNIIKNTAQSGIYVLNSAGTIITNNNIGATAAAGNIGADGIHLLNTTGASVSGNTIANTSSPSIEIGSGIYVENSDDATVSSNTIHNAKWDGIKVKGGSGVQVTGNNLYDLSRSGVAVDETDGTVVEGNTINNVILGVWSYFNSNIQIRDNDISNITSSPNSSGIQTYGDDTVLISGNTIDNTYLDGVYSKNSSNVTITGNTISNTGRAGAPAERGNGIRLDGGINNIISDNDITATKWDGIKVVSSDGIKVTGNNLHDLNRSGIGIDETDGAFISGNTIDNVILGVWSYRNSNIQILDNTISNITTSVNSNGIQSYEDDGVLISGNTIDNTYLDGVYSKNSSNVTITGNTISNTGRAGAPIERGNGIRLDGGTSNIISDNEITATKWDGIKVVSSNSVQITGNNVHDINRSGIAVDGTDSALISDNIIDNALLGVWSYINSNIQILDNNISNISSNGIQTYQDNGVIISGNTIDNTSNGVYSKNGSNISIVGNTIDNSEADGVYVEGYVPNNLIVLGEESLPLFSNGLYINDNTISNSSDNGIDVLNASDFIQISGNILDNSGENGIALNNIDGNISVLSNSISNSALDGIYANYVNRDLDTFGEGAPDYQVTITDNDIDNSSENGIELSDVGGVVTISSNDITDSDANGVLVYNTSSSEGEGEITLLAVVSNPLELHLVSNTILNTIGTGEGEGSTGINGFAAVNLDLDDGYAELSGNTLGNNFEYGLIAYSGTIDLTGASNTIQNTNIGLGFYPSDITPETDSSEYFDELAAKLILVGNTIGTTAFIDQASLFVDLGYGAFFSPGSPTILDGNNATYTLGGATIDPASNGGFVTDAELLTLETFINHYNDEQNRGLFFFSLSTTASAARTIDQKDVLRNFFAVPIADGNGGNLTITGLPSVGGTPTTGTPNAPFNPAAIEPAAGEDTTESSGGDVANIQPAAGGYTACWADATASLGQGSPVTFNFGSTGTALLQNAVNCGSGQGATSGQAL